MERSLWLLLRLRFAGWTRRVLRSLRTWKGLLFLLVASLFVLPPLAMALAPGLLIDTQVAVIEQHGPLAMLVYCVLNVLLSSGERAVNYSATEIDFLFAGPYRPRQVLLYKIAGGLIGALLSAALLTVLFHFHTRAIVPAFVGIYLALVMLYVFTISVSLFASTVGALAFDRRRKVLLVVAVGLVGLAFVQVGEGVLHLTPGEILTRMEESRVGRVVVAPFVPFIRAFTAARLWPDLVLWASVCLAIDAAMVALVVALSSRFYEATVLANEKVYERLRRVRGASAWTAGERFRFELPMLPRLGGIGPVAWRQGTSATRSLGRLIAGACLFLIPVIIAVIAWDPGPGNLALPIMPIAVPVCISLVAPSLIGFDFRPDVGRMDVLKSLPIDPKRLIVGQVMTPVFLMTLAQWLALGVVAAKFRPDTSLCVSVLLLTIPVNLFLFEIDNLFFLWYPADWIPVNSVDFQSLGRQIILTLARVACVGLMIAVAATFGAATYWLFDGRWSVTVAVAWISMLGFDLALLPLLAQAFESFDVAVDRIE